MQFEDYYGDEDDFDGEFDEDDEDDDGLDDDDDEDEEGNPTGAQQNPPECKQQ